MSFKNYVMTLLMSLCAVFVFSSYGSQKIIFKLDDFEFDPVKYTNEMNVTEGWIETIRYLSRHDIPASIGVIPEHLAQPSRKHNAWVQQLANSGYEFWHHGLDHDKNGQAGEFSGHSYEYQIAHVNKAYSLVKKNYKIAMKTIGTPYNQNDDVFLKIFEEEQRLTIGFFIKGTCPINKICLERFGMHLEEKVGTVNFAHFLKNYEVNKERPYLRLQGHPGQWSGEDLEEFNKVVNFLKSKNVTFTTPSTYSKDL